MYTKAIHANMRIARATKTSDVQKAPRKKNRREEKVTLREK
jgi:hypothetical protein